MITKGHAMITKKVFAAIMTSCAITLGASACAGTQTSESTGQYIDSAAVTTKVKAAIAKDKMLSVFDISVDTFKDQVQLSGFVNTAAQKAHATAVARNVEGVKEVDNNLVVKQ